MLSCLIYSDGIRQFISYFGVGGAAALVEWIMFFLLEHLLGVQYLLATVLAFIVSTTTNWILGRMFTFKNSSYKGRRLKELVLVFTVSIIGLGFNLVLMYLFVDCLHFDTGFLKTLAKIVATGIVFFWNFFARKLFIYKHNTGSAATDGIRKGSNGSRRGREVNEDKVHDAETAGRIDTE